LSLSKTKKASLNLAAYAGDGAVLLAFDLDQSKTDKLAGFAIKCKAPTKGPYSTDEHFLKNRLSFTQKITKDTKTDATTQVDSDKAPFQTYHWVHFPSAGQGKYRYTVYAAYFDSGVNIKLGDSVAINVDLTSQCNTKTSDPGPKQWIMTQQIT
jgi:hypothetical protein